MPLAPSIAVITPVRNGMPWLRETLDSIRAQNYKPLELVMVDDGSTDGTLDYLHSLNGLVSRLLRLDGLGPAAARNAGIQASSSEFIAFLDADDLWPPGILPPLSRALAANPPAGFARGLIRNFRTRPDGGKEYFTKPYRFVNLGACLWRRSLFAGVGLLDEGLTLCEDLDFLTRCWEKDVPRVDLDLVTLFYRRHQGGMTHGLSGAGLGTVKAYKRRIERIRAGEFDPARPRQFDVQLYLGDPPARQDDPLP